jgi:hypothetical protein
MSAVNERFAEGASQRLEFLEVPFSEYKNTLLQNKSKRSVEGKALSNEAKCADATESVRQHLFLYQ